MPHDDLWNQFDHAAIDAAINHERAILALRAEQHHLSPISIREGNTEYSWPGCVEAHALLARFAAYLAWWRDNKGEVTELVARTVYGKAIESAVPAAIRAEHHATQEKYFQKIRKTRAGQIRDSMLNQLHNSLRINATSVEAAARICWSRLPSFPPAMASHGTETPPATIRATGRRPSTARGLARLVVHNNPRASVTQLIALLDTSDPPVPPPEQWREKYKITAWTQAYEDTDIRRDVQKYLSKLRRETLGPPIRQNANGIRRNSPTTPR